MELKLTEPTWHVVCYLDYRTNINVATTVDN